MGWGIPNGEVVGKVHGEGIGAALPGTVLGAWDLAMPLEHVGSSIGVVDGLGHEAEGVVAAPLLPLLLQPVYHQFVYLLLLHNQMQAGRSILELK